MMSLVINNIEINVQNDVMVIKGNFGLSHALQHPIQPMHCTKASRNIKKYTSLGQ